VRADVLPPILEKLAELDDPSPTALIFSPAWPTRVVLSGQPSVSLTSFIGFRGEMPEQGIKHGQAISPWYRHPDDVTARKSQLLKYPAPEIKAQNVHPAAMLGVFDEQLDAEMVSKALKRAVQADHTRPTAAIAIVTNTNVRSTARKDQFPTATEALRKKNIDVYLGSSTQALPEKLAGVMTGAAGVDMKPYEGRLVPGAFAEHLTSFAATFDTPGQTKLTAWIKTGAAGSVGTVTEPYAIWTKFPRAAVFERYLSGQTLLEAVTQSIASPYQALIVGDPLCRPWGKPLKPFDLTATWEKNTLSVTANVGYDPDRTERHLFVDGKRVQGNGPVWSIPLDPAKRKKDVELILHARYNWSPPETGWIKKEIPLP
jgi:hypothetical protein